jgi:cell division protease FtsH
MKEELFCNIIGYDNTKITLKRILDVINNQEKYKELGSTIPHGLFLYGPPGIGKTSISKEFIKYANRKAYIIRKTKSDGNFINYLNNIFKKAIDNQPSLILLDDLDKFSENDNKLNNEEFVTVQSLIDEIKEQNVFVIATANNIKVLPVSLLRSGRFDIQIRLDNPEGKDSYEIINYYLKNKKIGKDVDINNISYILKGSSCADLEKVCNQAGIYAGFKNKRVIEMEDLLRASLEWAYDTNLENIYKENKYSLNVSYHEAGHALISEILEPDSISFITTMATNSDSKGMTIYKNNDNYFDDIKFMENRIKILLAGKAATEIVYHKCDVGSNSDLHRAINIARRFFDDYCIDGFDSWFYNEAETSEKVKQSKDDKTIKLLTDYYNETKELLIKNRPTLDLLAKQLKNKKILFQSEIEEIYNNSKKMLIY